MPLFHFRLEGHGSRAAAWQRQRTQRVVLCQLDFKIPGQCMVARWFLRGHPGSSLWEFIDVVTTAIKETCLYAQQSAPTCPTRRLGKTEAGHRRGMGTRAASGDNKGGDGAGKKQASGPT